MEHENANRVFLLNRDGKPLMPCCPRKARLLLKSGKAFVVIILCSTKNNNGFDKESKFY